MCIHPQRQHNHVQALANEEKELEQHVNACNATSKTRNQTPRKLSKKQKKKNSNNTTQTEKKQKRREQPERSATTGMEIRKGLSDFAKGAAWAAAYWRKQRWVTEKISRARIKPYVPNLQNAKPIQRDIPKRRENLRVRTSMHASEK